MTAAVFRLNDRRLVTGRSIAPWVAERALGAPSKANFAAGVERRGRLVAGFVIYGWNGVHALLSVRVDDPRGPTRAWWRLMFRYPFVELGAKRLRATVLAANERCVRLCLAAGMVEEHRMVDAHRGGDVLMFYMRREDCRFLDWR